ncbi:C4-dicarboxylate transporter/malic acid transport protein, partial [Phaeosphaeriaceae sp. SRC1lsM3a]
FTWSWFLLPLASLGLSLLLANLPLRFHGLNTIGKVFYLIGVTEFVVIGIFVTLRLSTKRGVFRRSITKDSEAYFFSIVMMCIASIIQGAHVYSNPKEGSRLSDTYRVVFWIYAPVAFLFALGMYSLLFTNRHHLQAANMTPAWMLPIFPVILTAPTAGIVASSLSPAQAFSVHFCGVLYMGLGLTIAIMILAIYIFRLCESHFPPPDSRPGMFLAVGPPAFTGVGLLKITAHVPDYSYFAKNPSVIVPLQALGWIAAVFLWMLAFYFCCLALAANLYTIRQTRFHLTWYSIIFPNCGLGIVLLDMSMLLECKAMEWVGAALVIVLAALWIVISCFHIEAV